MRIHCRAPDVPVSTYGLAGRFGELKPRVRRARIFQTVAEARNFLQTISHICT